MCGAISSSLIHLHAVVPNNTNDYLHLFNVVVCEFTQNSPPVKYIVSDMSSRAFCKLYLKQAYISIYVYLLITNLARN
jgi:hypothetical protein